ncbi:hypothetical protein [Leucobacter japonicus]|uniref:hypothetical protein n=1 Tax=Leucobacter japonicus TaxID=1461259 RepID=UPI0012E18884|nr:hypothetical protein [Leucobacter japonicus]
MMVPNPANWGAGYSVDDPAAQLATAMPREALKQARLDLLPTYASFLPRFQQVFHGPAMLLGDAGVHAIELSSGDASTHTIVAMPLSSTSFIAFASQPLSLSESEQVGRALRFKVAMESTVVIDHVEAPLLNTLVSTLWEVRRAPIGIGIPYTMRISHGPDAVGG